MKTLITALTLTPLISAPAFSQGMHQHEGMKMNDSMQAQEAQTSAMHAQMEKMKSLMERIKSEQDPQAREKLMKEHMAIMEEGMQLMNKGMTDDPNADAMNSEKRMNMMSDRMDMMQQMMEQMMGQMMEQKGMGGQTSGQGMPHM